jgi:ABC-type uncharacterized transport system substrate-binding protein
MTARKHLWAGLAAAAVALLAPGTIAHPHVWVTAAANLKFEAGKLTRVGMRWQFDAFFSQVLTGDFDKNQDGAFDADETKAMFDQVFTSLKDFGFFTHVRVGDAEVPFDHAENFTTAVDKGDLVYMFDLVLEQPVDPKVGPVKMAVYDPTIYVDIILGGDKPVTVESPDAAACAWSFSSGDEISNQGAFFTPQVVELSCGN